MTKVCCLLSIAFQADYIQRRVKKRRPKKAVVKKACSVKFDASCYSVFEENGCQYIKIMSLEKGKRIVIPLMGKGLIEGNVTLVMDEENIFIHVTKEIIFRNSIYLSDECEDGF